LITAVLRDVYYRHSRASLLSGVSLDFFEGEIAAVMGKPEARIILRLLSGIERPARGTVTVLGHDPYEEKDLLRREIGYAYRPQRLPSFLSVREFLALSVAMRGVDADFEWAVSELGIEDILNLRISSLQPHQAWLVSLAGAVSHRPRVLLLDDPLAGLEPLAVVKLMDVLRRMAEKGATVVIASSDLSLAPLLGRVIVMMNGGVKAVGRVSDLSRLLGRGDHVVIRTTNPRRALELASRIPSVKKLGVSTDGSLKIWLDNLEERLWPTLDLLAGMGVGIEGVSVVRMDPSTALGELLREVGGRET